LRPFHFIVAVCLFGFVGTAGAQTVVDGDTIKLNGTTWRLWGIDAPESKQWCGDYPAGVLATGTMEKLMKGKTIICEDRGHDRYGRTIGLCRADGKDLGADMVGLGMEWAFVRYSRDYVELEAKAKVTANRPKAVSVSIGSACSTHRAADRKLTFAFQFTRPGGATCKPRNLASSMVCLTKPVALASSIKSVT
jgi:hypothetical protein